MPASPRALSIVTATASAMLAFACGETAPPRNDRFGAGGDDTTSAVATGSTDMASSSNGGPATSGTNTSMAASSSSSSAASSAGAGAGSPCTNDANEANDDETTATDLGTTSDCDDVKIAAGVLTATDEDWFHYTGSDDTFCLTNPSREIQASGTVRICKFLESGADCNELTFTCPAGTSPATSPLGRSGCCANTDFEIAPSCDAFTGFAHIEVYIRIDPAPTESCVTYSLFHHY